MYVFFISADPRYFQKSNDRQLWDQVFLENFLRPVELCHYSVKNIIGMIWTWTNHEGEVKVEPTKYHFVTMRMCHWIILQHQNFLKIIQFKSEALFRSCSKYIKLQFLLRSLLPFFIWWFLQCWNICSLSSMLNYMCSLSSSVSCQTSSDDHYAVNRLQSLLEFWLSIFFLLMIAKCDA